MSKNSLDLSHKSEKFTGWIDPFKLVSQVANRFGIEFFVAGALARDVILYHGYGIEARTFTADIDFGVRVEEWGQFESLVEGLINTGMFRRQGAHRLYFSEGGGSPTPIDIVPFGVISTQDGSITWPPKNEVRMNVLGFDEAFTHCLWIKLTRNPDFEMPFSSIAGLALMKLIAWNDGYIGNTSDINSRLKKDSSDLLLIIKSYFDAGNSKRIFDGENADILEIVGDNNTLYLAGARLLGRDIAEMCNKESRASVLEILDREANPHNRENKLIENMLNSPVAGPFDFDLCMDMLQQLNEGVKDTSVQH